jgi:hypothetical protein
MAQWYLHGRIATGGSSHCWSIGVCGKGLGRGQIPSHECVAKAVIVMLS